jgi:hypothetical protein
MTGTGQNSKLKRYRKSFRRRRRLIKDSSVFSDRKSKRNSSNYSTAKNLQTKESLNANKKSIILLAPFTRSRINSSKSSKLSEFSKPSAKKHYRKPSH